MDTLQPRTIPGSLSFLVPSIAAACYSKAASAITALTKLVKSSGDPTLIDFTPSFTDSMIWSARLAVMAWKLNGGSSLVPGA